ncbi:MAG: TldD/PmbA family protein [Holophagales bacterium]|jgi:PmbA protein|nr:TldD/PmbA family protein [Holophagales bacterium]
MISQELEDAVTTGVRYVKTLGACGAEAYLSVSRSRRAKSQNGVLEDLTRSKRGGLGVRVLRQGPDGIRVGSATTSDLSRRDVKDLFKQAWELSSLGDEDPWIRQADPEGADDLPSRFDASTELLTAEDRVRRARLLEEAARNASPRVCAVRDSSWADGSGASLLLTDKGVRALDMASTCSASIELAAEWDDDRQAACHWDIGRSPDSINIEAVGREAAKKAEQKLKPKQLPAGKYTVALHPEVSVDMLGIVASMLNAESVLRGRSLFADKLDSAIASPLLTLIDDGRMPYGLGTAPWDGEGVPTRRNVLIQDGVLASYLHNLRTAAEMGATTTANASRGTTGAGITTFNLFPLAGAKNAESIITQVKDGVMITEIMGLHTVNPVSGDMSVGASGIRIRNGTLEESVDRMTFAGNLRDLLLSIVEVGSDLRWYGSSAGLTMLLEEVTLGGG